MNKASGSLVRDRRGSKAISIRGHGSKVEKQ